jgi:hypothetical protein
MQVSIQLSRDRREEYCQQRIREWKRKMYGGNAVPAILFIIYLRCNKPIELLKPMNLSQ